nr:TetR/AcrR family transcriptional regulator [Hyphomonas sp. Mor2]
MRDQKMPGRPREFDDTEMLRKIMMLFWSNGFEGVSLSDIMAETGLRKASLYAAFGDKRSMYLNALAQYHSDVVADAARALRDETSPPLDRIEAFLTAPLRAAQAQDRTGCFLCNASADQADLDEDTKAQVRTGFEQLGRALESALSDAQPQLSEADRAARAQALLALYAGFRILVRSGSAIAPLEAAIAEALEMAKRG